MSSSTLSTADWQFKRPVPNAVQYGTFFITHPVLGDRLHLLHCDTSKPQGICSWIIYTGDQLNGTGTVIANCQYGRRSYQVRVENGILYAFGKKTNLRKPYKPTTYGYEQKVLV